MPETLEVRSIVVDGVTKYSLSYPLTDESGQPLLDRNQKPRFTNLVAGSPEELAVKVAEANIEVARALNRSQRHNEILQGRRPTAAATPAKIEAKPLTQDEKVQVGLDTQDPRKAADAIQRVVESVVPVEQIRTEVQRQGKKLDTKDRHDIALAFFRAEPDYLPVEGNNALLNKYLAENNLEFSVENLQFAYATLSVANKLAVARRAASAPANDPPPSPANASPDNAPPNDAPNSGTPPAQERRAPVGGIRNDQVGARPAGDTTVLTKTQALEMLYRDPQKYESWMRDPVKNAILNRALASRT